MAKDKGSLIFSPATPLKSGSLKATTSNMTNGEAGHPKRTGSGRFPELNRVTGPRLENAPKPTKK